MAKGFSISNSKIRHGDPNWLRTQVLEKRKTAEVVAHVNPFRYLEREIRTSSSGG
jgi:hypothetical protein